MAIKYYLLYFLLFFTCFLKGQDTLDIRKFNTPKNPHTINPSLVIYLKEKSPKLSSKSIHLIRDQYHLALASKKYDTALVLFNAIADYEIFQTIEHEKTLKDCANYMKYLSQCNDPKQVGKFYVNYSEVLTYNQQHEESLRILKQAIRYLKKVNDSTMYEYAYVYLKAGENSTYLQDFQESSKYFENARKLFQRQKDTLFYLWTQNSYSALLSKNGLYDIAEKERKPIFELGEKIKAYDVMAIANITAIFDQRKLGNKNLEMHYAQNALNNLKHKKTDISEIVSQLTYSVTSEVYARNNQLGISDKLLKLSKNENKSPFLATYHKRAYIYNSIGHEYYQKAYQLLKEYDPLVRKSRDAQLLLELEKLWAQVQEKKGNLKSSLTHYKNFVRIRDSLNDKASQKRFEYVQAQFDVKKRDLQIEQQNKNIHSLSIENNLKTKLIWSTAIVLSLLFLTIYLLRSSLFSKRKMKLEKEYAQNLIRKTEYERKRIAQELHDGVAQYLMLIKNNYYQSYKEYNETLLELMNITIKEVRSISNGLHPFYIEEHGLLESVRHIIEQYQKSSSIFYSADIPDKISIQETEIEVTLYRMIQECLNNVEKHSKAKACKVSIFENNDALYIEIKDNGKGFEFGKNYRLNETLGMKTLKERAQLINANIDFNSEKGKGTTIKIML